MEKTPKKVKFIHNFPKDYKIYPINGAWGGISPRGDLIMHFFVEGHAVPKETIQKIKEDGSLGPIEIQKEEIQVTRDMQIGIVMNREQALGIAEWMIDRVKEFEKRPPKGGSSEE